MSSSAGFADLIRMNISRARLFWLYLRGPLFWGGLITSTIGTVLIVVGIHVSRSIDDFQRHAVATVGHVITKKGGAPACAKPGHKEGSGPGGRRVFPIEI